MAEQKELFSEQEQYAACSRFKKCRKCKRRLHADHKERFETRVAGLCYACVRDFEKSSHWDIDRFLGVANVAAKEFMEEADEFEGMLPTSLEPVRIEERLVNRIGVREWGVPTLVIPGQIWRSEKHGTITCVLPHPTDPKHVSIETRSLEVIPDTHGVPSH